MSINYAKLKTNLSLAMQRLKLLEKKKTELTQKSRKEIADYIGEGKVERARIRVEHIIREDYLVEAMEIVEMYCDLLLARFGMIQQLKTLDDGLEEAVSSLIWVAPRMQADVKELKVVADLLAGKYGKQYAEAVRNNSLRSVNEKLMIKLGVQSPPKVLVEKYLIEIAKVLNVHYEPDEEVLREDEKYRASMSSASGLEPCTLNPLIDFSAVGGATQPPVVMPPPLPSFQPSAGAAAQAPGPKDKLEESKDHPPIGFNVDAAASVPPSYNSVIGGGQQPQLPTAPPSNNNNNNNKADLDFEASFPAMPDIPIDDLDLSDKSNDSKKSGNNNNNNNSNINPNDNTNTDVNTNTNTGQDDQDNAGNDDVDFDEIQRRFSELKKKK